MSLEDEMQNNYIPQPATKNTTKSNVEKIDGEGNQLIQATTVVYNVTNNYLKDGSLEKGYKSGVNILNRENEEQDNIDDRTDSSDEEESSSEEKIIEEIEASTNDETFVNTARTKSKFGSSMLPANSKEIEVWYYQELDARERCFVNACAVLHGATLRAIAEATRELYTTQKEKSQPTTKIADQVSPVREEPPVEFTSTQIPESLAWIFRMGQQDERIRAIQARATQEERVPQSVAAPEELSLPSLDTLLERTYTYHSYTNGATRIFWKDTDSSGLSNFSIDLLRFLARKTAIDDMFDIQPEQSFLDIVRQWPAKYQGERSWRSANALGVIWWHQDARNLLSRQAEKWAKSQQKQDWGYAAALLDGAYQVERVTMKAGTNENIHSSVLELLEKWIVTTHKWITQANQTAIKRGEGYAAARAYALIGRKSPEVALNGLDRLLHFPPQSQHVLRNGRDPAEDLLIFGVLKYVDVARAGHIRQVIKHLADGAIQYINQQASSYLNHRRGTVDEQNSAALHVILTAFFLVASCSLSAVDANMAAIYSPFEHLDAHPSCPDNKGKDILLAGILTKTEPHWQNQLATLLASIILEKNYPSAFYLIIRWGTIVLKDQSKDAALLEEAYAHFLIKVGQQVSIWSTNQGTTRQVALGTYKRKLMLWQTDKHLPQPHFKDLARKVLKDLP